MTALYIDRRGAAVDLEGDTLVVRVDGRREGTAPLGALSRVVVYGSAQFGTRLVARLAERGIGLVLLPGRASQPASVLCPARGDAARRIAQLRLLQDQPRRAALSLDLVRAKLSGQTRLLRRAERGLPAGRDRYHLTRALDRLDRAGSRLASSEPVPARAALRGIEGAAASAYFTGLGCLVPAGLGFKGRNRRPPRDPVNVCLSLGYTLLHNRAVHALAAAGLDPAIGIYHDPLPGRDSLACDLAEPLRPLVDAVVLNLFGSAILTGKDFSVQGTACRMGKAGRAACYRAFEDRLGSADRLLRRAVSGLVAELDGGTGAAARLPHVR